MVEGCRICFRAEKLRDADEVPRGGWVGALCALPPLHTYTFSLQIWPLAVRGEGASFSQGCPRQAPQPGEVGNPASERAGAGVMLGAKASPADVALSPAADHKIWLKFSLRPLLIIFWDR